MSRPKPADERRAAMLAAALAYADRGWPVFVLPGRKAKIPAANCAYCRAEHRTPQQREACVHLMCHGFYAATRDPGRITAMLARRPAGLLAVRTGTPSNTVVVDVDPPAGLATLARLDQPRLLPGTRTARTGHRGGLHLYYAHPGGPPLKTRAGGLGAGIDIKADGGYVIVPPSIDPATGRAYRWLGNPQRALTALPLLTVQRLGTAARRWPDPSMIGPMPAVRGGAAGRRLAGLVSTVLRARPGERNTTLYWAACRVADMAAAGDIDPAPAVQALGRAALQNGLPRSEAQATIDSGLSTTTTAA